MTCQHRHTTVTRAHLDDGTPVTIHQCDNCGLAVPHKEATDLDVWDLPEWDETIAERGYERLAERAFGLDGQRTENVINFAKGVRHDRNTGRPTRTNPSIG